MRILITGSSGQIGSNLGLYLQRQGHQGFGVDKRPNPWTRQIETVIQDLSRPYTNFSGGIGNMTYPDNLDAVVHLAAHAKVHELVEQPDRALENVIMTYNAAEFCRQNRLPLIFSSSRETYGNLRHKQETTSEEMADFSLSASPYAASKIAGEATVYSYAQCYELPYLVFRFSNVYGRFDNDLERMERVIPLFIRKISRGEPVTIYGKEKVLDFTYIDDCVSGVTSGIEALASGRVVNQTINLAYGQGNSLIAMTDFICEALGKKANVTIEPSLRGEVTNYIADIGKAQKLLGYNPTTALREGIFKAVAWSQEWEEREK
ncbi:MAG TPA: NAD(P)-dependent oxidoreductase [Anaerolineae bacterium]|nr:NAD(P)-dependent oxidoreductase [Anaerolineae bacterium]